MQEKSEVILEPSEISGRVDIPPSKSFAHRALICAALSGEESTVHNIDMSRDMEASFSFIRAIGTLPEYDSEKRMVRLYPGKCEKSSVINCIESGSTLRFVVPILAALGADAKFIGEGRLPERPMTVYTDMLPLHGVSCKGQGLPLEISGKLSAGVFSIPGNISSQFITGLLLALPLLDFDSRIELTSELQSESYVNITLSVMESFGVKAEKIDNGYLIPGGQHYSCPEYTVEGDWSQAAFFLSMAAFSEKGIEVLGLNNDSVQGDRKCLEVYSDLGLEIEKRSNGFFAYNPRFSQSFHGLSAIELDASDIPDMVPALSVVCAFASGESRIFGAQRLRLKESDRLKAVSDGLLAIGAEVKELDDGLIINGVNTGKGGNVDGCNDHRIVMAFSAAAAVCQNPVTLSYAMSINKSYPGFYRDYRKLGGICNVIMLGK